MTLDEFIATVSDGPCIPAHFQDLARNMDISSGDLCDRFAVTVAQHYLDGRYSFTFADGAMNNLFAFMTGHLETDPPRIAWSVYEAFDDGEYIHAGEAKDQQGEVRTRALLSRMDAVTNRTV